jgi:hypothetical protein
MGDMSRCKHDGLQGYCDTCNPNLEAEMERDDWTMDRQAEHMIHGMSAKDALQKAMEDRHIYKAANVELTGSR